MECDSRCARRVSSAVPMVNPLTARCIGFVPPYALQRILKALADPSPDAKRTAYFFALIAFLANLSFAQVDANQRWFTRRCYERARGQLFCTLHHKCVCPVLAPCSTSSPRLDFQSVKATRHQREEHPEGRCRRGRRRQRRSWEDRQSNAVSLTVPGPARYSRCAGAEEMRTQSPTVSGSSQASSLHLSV